MRGSLPEKFDIVVAGAGVAGAMIAKRLAASGYSVLLVDRKPERLLGKKVCGDAIGLHHFKNIGMEIHENFIRNRVRGVKIYSPNTKIVFSIQGDGVVLERERFGRFLIKSAVNSGAEVRTSTYATKPLVNGDSVIGVELFDLKRRHVYRVYARIVVDSTGAVATLRRRLPRKFWASEEVSIEDYNIAYREIRVLDSEIEEIDFMSIYLSNTIAPGGYWWIIPRSKYEINIGLGVQMREKYPNPKINFYRYIVTKSIFNRSRILHSGSALVPTRRPIAAPVANGFVAVGDAAMTANPIHGGGIGPAMMSALLASRAIEHALDEGDPSIENLWSYPLNYMRSYGAKQAALDIFRLFLQKLEDDDLNYGMEKRLITEEDVYIASTDGELRISTIDKAMRVLRGLTRPSLLFKLKLVAEYMYALKMHYYNYPSSPREFPRWYNKGENLLAKYLSKLYS